MKSTLQVQFQSKTSQTAEEGKKAKKANNKNKTARAPPLPLSKILKTQKNFYLHNFPRVLLNSALCRLGYWSPNRRLAAWAHTMKAFMGRLTCVLRFSNLKW